MNEKHCWSHQSPHASHSVAPASPESMAWIQLRDLKPWKKKMLKCLDSSPCPFPISVCLLGNDYFSHLCCKMLPIWLFILKKSHFFVWNDGRFPLCSSLVPGDTRSGPRPATGCPHLLAHLGFSACGCGRGVAVFPVGNEDINQASESNKENEIVPCLRQTEIRANVMRSLIF